MSTWVHSPAAVFPSLAEIPTTARTDYYDGAFYLVNGELRRWEGPCREVLSPVWLRGDKGAEAHRLGRYPLLSEAESLAALDAAEKA
jgi:glyceraldehyde-3-phosphate dehydrogenase (NADP+)